MTIESSSISSSSSAMVASGSGETPRSSNPGSLIVSSVSALNFSKSAAGIGRACEASSSSSTISAAFDPGIYDLSETEE